MTIEPAAEAFLKRAAQALGVAPPTSEEIETLLAVAGLAAHASHRQAAPVTCWLVAKSGLQVAAAHQRIEQLAAPRAEGSDRRT